MTRGYVHWSCGVNGHTTRCTGPVSVVLRLFSWCPTEGYRKRRSTPLPHGP